MMYWKGWFLYILLVLSTCTAVCQVGSMWNTWTAAEPVFRWRCAAGDGELNFNPSTTGALAFDSIPYAEEYTVVAVYKPVADSEALVWRLTYGDTIVRALTTRHILTGSGSIRYDDFGDGRPVIHTLRQSAPERDSSVVRLTLGDSNLRVAEVLYFDRRIDNAALRRVQSALAVRYGITLGPVDYVGSDGTRVWRHRCGGTRYHHRITGVGTDSVYGLCQLRSCSEMEGGMVTVSTSDSLISGTYLLLGDDDGPLSFAGDTLYGVACEVLSRTWLVQSTEAQDNRFSLTFATRGFALPSDSLMLVVDGGIYLPNAVTADAVHFDGVAFPPDSSHLTLARGAELRALASLSYGANTRHTPLPTLHSRISLYPNPTVGHYTLEVTDARWVQVSVYSLQGKLMATYEDSDRAAYRFEGELPSGNVYYATVTTETGSQTLKLVVK